MTTIWKTVLASSGVKQIMVPAGSEMLCAREQFEHICVWYRCKPTAPFEPRSLAVVATGEPSPDADGRYLGTAILQGGNLVFHVFERV